MKKSTFVLLLMLVLGFPGMADLHASPEEKPPEVSSFTLVTPEAVDARIAEVEATTELTEQNRKELLEFYRNTLSNLQAIASNEEASRAFQQAAEVAHQRMEAQASGAAEGAAAESDESVELGLSSPVREIEKLLQKEKAALAALDARRADYDKQLGAETNRPLHIRKRISEAKREQEEVTLQLKISPPAEESLVTTQARLWAWETRYQALKTEIQMLDQELLTRPIRFKLLEVGMDLTLGSMDTAEKRVALLQDLATRKHQDEADLAKAHAETTRQEAVGKHSLVVKLAERNAMLSEQVASIASGLDELGLRASKADKLARRIENDFKSARESIEIGGFSQVLGHMLLQQRLSLPEPGLLLRRVKERERSASQTGVQRLRHRQEQGMLRDLDEFVSGTLLKAPGDESPMLREQLHELAVERRVLLEKAIESDDFYLRKLGELDTTQQRLLEAIENYDAFLDINLLWARSATRTQLEALGALPEEMWRMLSPKGWKEVVQSLRYQLTHSPVFILLALALAFLIWRRNRYITAIRDTREGIGKPTTDHFTFTLHALLLTLVVAATWPLLMTVVGWQLKVSLEGSSFSTAVGAAFISIALQVFYLRALHGICMPGGLAEAHFRWPESNLRLLRRELRRLTWIYLPAISVAIIAFNLDPLNVGWIIGQAAFLILVLSVVATIYFLLHPRRGVLAEYVRQRNSRTLKNLLWLSHLALVAYPLVLGGLSLMGYIYTAGTLFGIMMQTIWLIVGLVIFSAVAQRWLLVTRRHLVYEAAMERRQAMLEAGEEQGDAHKALASELEEPEVDFVALSDTSRKLLNTALFVTGIFGLWMIWAEVLPALHIFNEVTLWHQTLIVNGEQQLKPVTLANLGLALIYLGATIILARQLPAVLEIILLHNTGMSASGRYTVTTLTNYVIFSIGILIIFNTMGTDWSKLQWLVAALGVGIGFGLQEIVANFISGIIILFERPVRVGDVVSVGDTDGIVTRIRIRATTIRNWDGKELLVPNKEFITGRLLNWSLSDPTTRLLIRVGIAYGANVPQAMDLLERVAKENDDVLDEPTPSVIFESFGDNSLNLILRCFVEEVDQRLRVVSNLNQAINERFNEAGIVIAFPQRDLHFDTSEPLRISIEDARVGKG